MVTKFKMEQKDMTVLFILSVLHNIIFSFVLTLSSASKNDCYKPNSNFINTENALDIDFESINKSEITDTKFVNLKLNAKNVLEIPVPFQILTDLREYFDKYVEPYLVEGKYVGGLKGPGKHKFYCVAPNNWGSDIQWISVDSRSTYNYFVPYFKDIGLDDIFKDIIDVEKEIVIYNVFFVVRSRCQQHKWHIDFYRGTNVNAFTFLTPLQDKNYINLAYRDLNNEEQLYEYKRGTAIAFGENFMHSTNVTPKGDREVLFCLSFGTDKLRDWEVIRQTAAVQGNYYMHPIRGYTNIQDTVSL